MLKAYVNPLSPPSNKVLFCLHALDLEYERVLIDLTKGEQGQPSFKALNPFGKVPVIDDDGFILFESGAILSYLARREKSDLYPSTYQERALVDQWCQFSLEMLQGAVQKVFFNRVIAPMISAPVSDNNIKQGLRLLDAYLPVLNQHLQEKQFVCGESLSLADLTLLSVLDPAEVSNIELSSNAALVTWRDRMRSQGFYTRTHSHYGAGIFDRG